MYLCGFSRTMQLNKAAECFSAFYSDWARCDLVTGSGSLDIYACFGADHACNVQRVNHEIKFIITGFPKSPL